ncbi:hypothetical protein [Nocardiopsis sp. FIRDI 009]|uniref:hypothetical protein n=1 Tax=Nocardiopsis sp. FIRDI 009 TaxID=714197 RepID=UPI0013009A06|nr:hypothetical protein [Nocardiopsis sp. FIRDI 009]
MLNDPAYASGTWAVEWGISAPRLWLWALGSAPLAVLYCVAAARLGRGGRTARDTVLTALALDAALAVADTTVLTATDPLVEDWVTAVVAWTVGLVVNLIVPAFLLVLLWVLQSSRDWLRATDTLS